MSDNIQKSRVGDTKVTSVSVSKKFQEFIAQHNLSPTECFRRGIAVTLCDLGVGMYQSEKNEVRSKFMQEFMQKIAMDEQYKQLEEDMEKVKELIADIKNKKQLLACITEKYLYGEIKDDDAGERE